MADWERVGSVPGYPRSKGCTFVLDAAAAADDDVLACFVGADEKSFVGTASCACISIPMIV